MCDPTLAHILPLLYFCYMNVKNRLKNNLVRKIQMLSTDKLTEVDRFLGKFEEQLKSKEKTLSMAGLWKNLDSDFFMDLTDKLHDLRINDRQIN
jgi:hypothetical protein